MRHLADDTPPAHLPMFRSAHFGPLSKSRGIRPKTSREEMSIHQRTNEQNKCMSTIPVSLTASFGGQQATIIRSKRLIWSCPPVDGPTVSFRRLNETTRTTTDADSCVGCRQLRHVCVRLVMEPAPKVGALRVDTVQTVDRWHPS